MRRMTGCTKVLCGAAALMALATAADAQVRISQVYGGGGNGGATWRNDYIELFNAGSAAVDLTGMSVQYGAATGTTWQVTALGSVLLQPGQYYLIQEASGGTGGVVLPFAADATGTINLSATNGKVALVSNTTALTGACPTTNIVDLIGFGTANCFEGAAAPAGSNILGLFRAGNGCVDSNNNSSDFATATPAPRGTGSPLSPCTPSTPPQGSGSSSPASQCPGFDVVLTVQVTPGTSPTSTGITVVGDLSPIGGVGGVAFLDDGVAPDAVAGDNIFTASGTVTSDQNPGNRSIQVVITDAQNRTGAATITLAVNNCNPRGTGAATPSGICTGESSLLTVAVTPGVQPTSTGITVSVDLSAIGGNFGTAFHDDGLDGDAVAGDNVFSYLATVAPGTPAGGVTMLAIISDDQGRGGTTNIELVTADCANSNSTVVIEQVYGGGGNNNGVWRNDFIVLFNRSADPVDITGWSVQYASAGGTGGFANKTDLTGIIPAGGYYLIQESAGADQSQPELPPADAVGTILVGSTGGRVALVTDGVLIANDCGTGTVVDLVGYGTANCFEGIAPAPVTSNPVGVLRRNAGCFDSNNNGVDFSLGTPIPRNSSTPLNFCNGTPPGACCLASGSCVSTADAAACTAQGGTFQGAGTVCGTTNCPQPAGACCLPSGSCVSTADAAACTAQGGVFQGSGTTCGATQCPQPCACDFDQSGALNSADFFAFLTAFFQASNSADFDHSGVVNSADFFAFLTCFFQPPAGCH